MSHIYSIRHSAATPAARCRAADVPRAWFYLEDTVPCVEETMHGYLATIGKRLHSARYRINAANHVSAHLYDLSDPALLGETDADSYRLPDCAR